MKILIFLALMFIPLISIAQSFKVENFIEEVNSKDAIERPRYDINGEMGALIHVEVNAEGLEFGGNIIENIETPIGYDVYVLDGTSSIAIQHPNLRILKLKTSDFGLSSLKSGKTYSLVLSLDVSLSNRVENKHNPNEITTGINDQIILIDKVRYFNVIQQQLNGYDSNGRRASIPKFIIQCEVSLWNGSVNSEERWKALSHLSLKSNQIAIIKSKTGKVEILSNQEFQKKINNDKADFSGIVYVIGDKSNKILNIIPDFNLINSWELTLNVPYDERFFQHREYKPMNITYKIIALDLSSDSNIGKN